MRMRIAIGIFGVVTMALIVGPADSSARGGAMAGGRGAPMAGLPAAPVRPAVAPALPATTAPRSAVAPAHIHARGPLARSLHRRFLRDGSFAGYWGYPSYG